MKTPARLTGKEKNRCWQVDLVRLNYLPEPNIQNTVMKESKFMI